MRAATHVPIQLPLVGCLFRYFGFQWDIAWHILIGRDSFWLPPHWMVYFGVALVLVSGLFPIWRGRGRAPMGSYLLASSALAQITAAPIDDLWHRLYGIDNTLWSPPHLAFILSGSVTPLALMLLLRGHHLSNAPIGRGWLDSTLVLSWRPHQLLRNPSLMLCGLSLAWLDFTLTEFRFHLPQQIFPWDFALFPPIMITIALLAGLIGMVITGLPAPHACHPQLHRHRHSGQRGAHAVVRGAIGDARPRMAFEWLAGDPVCPDAIAFGDSGRSRHGPPDPPEATPRLVLASLVFAALFYAVQFPYSRLTPPAWNRSCSEVCPWRCF